MSTWSPPWRIQAILEVTPAYPFLSLSSLRSWYFEVNIEKKIQSHSHTHTLYYTIIIITTFYFFTHVLCAKPKPKYYQPTHRGIKYKPYFFIFLVNCQFCVAKRIFCGRLLFDLQFSLEPFMWNIKHTRLLWQKRPPPAASKKALQLFSYKALQTVNQTGV